MSVKKNDKILNIPVIIMAGGEGLRLKPLTNILPKPLLPYGDSTIIENIMNRFIKFNCREFYLSVNYKAEIIEFYFSNLKNKNYLIHFVFEKKPLGTAGSLSLLKNQFKTSIFVTNCDVLIDEDYSEIYKFHKNKNYELTIIATSKSNIIPYGVVNLDSNGNFANIIEKPHTTYIINCGMYILEPHLLNEIPDNMFYHITELIQNIKNRKGKIGVFLIDEKNWIDAGNIENLDFLKV
ncbi:sugar phosphate nucleotidyltransferase [Apibacter raozihei]|uniref:sugar phosphate nucleotidyltransferase n=1 Tax=Apibacter raozihei TaxID=2500547 RepID=UPI000FE3650C|nr:sugar phosphate nucleotidyltransferase [Apibacter raozihei]